ncbi:hit finger domain protein [Grosmannia clavigera kw1407]|uniref:Hit finger domain protein n=1 Tax=Grosmannia clavigera (strain kw1407 / UAMH 11150) TaxID=655863 RepID=F0X920_GROCL|nr:hit finger domain protein [Grosmannia clavigera kw1407]EFX05209.1 hit finger domain protein [Grosmannia clavigera kw1407]
MGFGAFASAAPKTGTSNRKRAARSQAGTGFASYSDLTSRQEAKLRKELEVLERDSGAGVGPRDAAIPIPAKAVKAQNKHTPTVRKILASQKTFANHLDDFLAMTALHENSHNEGTPSGRGAAAAAAVPSTATSEAETAPASGRGKRTAKKEAAKRESKKRQSISTTAKVAPTDDTPMPEASAAASSTPETPAPPSSAILRPYAGPRPAPQTSDGDPLLVSYVPPLPTDDELRALLAAPPLSYAEARATWPTESAAGGSAPERRYPARVFCEICGYWGRIKCTKCGTPLCALDCLEMHREDCITRYGL